MKTITLHKIVLLNAMFLILFVSKAQTGSLYGIRTSQSNYSSQLIKINPTTGSITVISPSSFGYGMVFPVSAIDPVGKFYYFTTPGDTLFSVNLNSGVASKVKLSSAGTYSAPILEFNSFDNTLYGITQKNSNNLNYLCKINPATGSVTLLSASGFSSTSTVTGSSLTPNYLMNSTLDPANNLFYITSEYYSDTLYGFNLTTGNIDVRKRLSCNFSFTVPTYYQPQLEFSCSDASLYAMVKFNMNSMMYLSKVNISTGVVTVLSSNPISKNSLGAKTLDPVTKNYFSTNVPDSLYLTDLTTGNLTVKNSLTNSGYWISSIEHEKLCSQTGILTHNENKSPIQLYPNPSSGILNITTDANDIDVVMINSLGQSVFSQHLDHGTNQIHFKNLAPGLYFCIVKQNNKIVDNTKLLIE
jgi:hypothetical protein